MNRTQEVELTNMCFIYDENRILVEEKKGTKYTNGLVFPGGHIEQGESFRSFVKTQSVFEKALYWLREGEQGNEIRNCLY